MSNSNVDSPSGRQWHVRYRLTSHGPHARPVRSAIYEDEQEAVGALAEIERFYGVADVKLMVCDVTPWRDA